MFSDQLSSLMPDSDWQVPASLTLVTHGLFQALSFHPILFVLIPLNAFGFTQGITCGGLFSTLQYSTWPQGPPVQISVCGTRLPMPSRPLSLFCTRYRDASMRHDSILTLLLDSDVDLQPTGTRPNVDILRDSILGRY